MRKITNLLIKEFKINELGFDFMGYSLQHHDKYTYHHLIIPARKGGPDTTWNGAVLCGKTAHEYLHRIEGVDLDIFNLITSEMVDMKIKGFLDAKNLRKINDLLTNFEKEYDWLMTKKGKPLIKLDYLRRNKF